MRSIQLQYVTESFVSSDHTSCYAHSLKAGSSSDNRQHSALRHKSNRGNFHVRRGRNIYSTTIHARLGKAKDQRSRNAAARRRVSDTFKCPEQNTNQDEMRWVGMRHEMNQHNNSGSATLSTNCTCGTSNFLYLMDCSIMPFASRQERRPPDQGIEPVALQPFF